MSYNEKVLQLLRRNCFNAFRVVNGTQDCRIKVINASKNIYRDRTTSIEEATFSSKCYIQISPPIKTVQRLGFWRDGEALPMIMYIPHIEGYAPKRDDIIEVVDSGIMNGTFVVQEPKMFGIDQPVCWALTIAPKRV